MNEQINIPQRINGVFSTENTLSILVYKKCNIEAAEIKQQLSITAINF
ncbi:MULTISPECIES: hypothetical protein [Chryseobacterium]|jgi:hypothetical protein|nr:MULTISPECIES: hypothetical protein [Chryseobacterium]UCA58832.1 hypothetical protein KB553_17480 [Chryseobacterium rhizoplanae]